MIRIALSLLLLCSLPTIVEAQGWRSALRSAVRLGQSFMINDEDLAEYAQQQVAYMDKNNRICNAQSAYTKRLNRLTRSMTDADGIPLNFKVYQTNEINAFACPDGSIRVYSALMDALSDNELIGVLGHEIGHVALRHTKQAWKSALRRSAASEALAAMSDTYYALSESVLGELSSVVFSARHSRSQETEADDYGYTFLKENGRNPWAMAIAFEKMKKLSKSGGSRWAKYLKAFSSHPDFDSRIHRMSERAKDDGYQRP
ncbi:MAG: M48 family metalloprotease [Bacteroidaceae bacterium]|nr:M48 family metalloprotease [Bacteroidaceae bacterium]